MNRLLLVPVVIAACGWSWLSYLLTGFPKDKLVYRADAWGWLSEAMAPAWNDFRNREPSTLYHELKNLGAEWCRAWPQTAAKVLSLFILLALLLGLLAGFGLGLLV